MMLVRRKVRQWKREKVAKGMIVTAISDMAWDRLYTYVRSAWRST